jgi:arylsulfatase A-like enzyme
LTFSAPERDDLPARDGPVIPPSECVRTRRWKYIHYLGADPAVEQLFDLESDPLEEHDLSADAAHAETLAQLRARCTELRAEAR